MMMLSPSSCTRRGGGGSHVAALLRVLSCCILVFQLCTVNQVQAQASTNATADATDSIGPVNSTSLDEIANVTTGNGTEPLQNITEAEVGIGNEENVTDSAVNVTEPPPPAKEEEEDFGSKVSGITKEVTDAFTVGDCSLLQGLQGCNSSFTSGDIASSAILNAVLGVLCFLSFGALRSHIKVYRARLASPATTIKPPKLPEGGLLQIVSWIIPVIGMSDESLLASAGLDALMFSRFLMLCVQFFVPVTLFSVGVLLPIHYTSDGEYNRCRYDTPIINQDPLQRTTISNACANDKYLWVHFVFIYLTLAWAMWLLQKHYVTYASLRHYYIGLPQKPNYWFEKFIQSQDPNNADKHNGLCSPTSISMSEDTFLSPRENVSVGSPFTPTENKEVETNASNLVFSVTNLKDVARAWMRPDKLFNHKGQEPEDLKMFTSQHPGESVKIEKSDFKTTFHGEDTSIATSANLISTSMSLHIASESTPMQGVTSGSQSKSLESQQSFAALKWWDIYTESFRSSKKKGQEREVMMRPSVRHIKGVNSVMEGKLVSVNAAQYAVLVTDIPRSSTDIDHLRRSHTHTPGTSFDFDNEDPDALRMITRHDDICTEIFKQIFPRSFKNVVPVQDFSEVTKYLLQWDKASQQLEVLEALFELDGVRRTMKTGFLGLYGERVDSITYYKNRVEDLSVKIKRARRKAQSSRAARSSFVLFDNQVDAAAAAQSVLLPMDGTKFVTHRAPGPDNVNWMTLLKTSKERFLRKVLMLPLIAIIMLFPAGFFSAAMGVFDVALCQEGSEIYWDWYCKTQSPIGQLLKRLVTGWLPSLLVTIWQNLVVTRTFYMVSLVECVAFSLSGVDRRITSLYFYWDFINIFLGAVLGAGLFTIFGQALSLNDVQEILQTLGAALAGSANFMTNYALLRALFLVPLKLVFPHPGILNYLVRHMLSLMCFKGVGITRRQRYQAWEPKSFMYGREAGTALLMTLIGVSYVATSPVTVAIVTFYFIGMYVVCRHHLLYVYARNYESGGELFPVLFDRFVIMLVTLSYFMAFQLLTKQAWTQAVLLFLTTPFILYKFHSICTKRYREVSSNVPLDIAWRQPVADVPPQMYIPSELRSQSVGWHPEQGKTWSGYGMPRFL